MRSEHAIPLLLGLAAAALAGCPDPSADDASSSPGLDAAGLDAPGLDAFLPGVDAHVDPSIDAAGLDAPLGEVIPPDDPGAADVRFEISSLERRHPISPWIYGSNQVEPSAAHGESMGRLGGNRWTAYNWETNASNAGSDYLYQNDTYLGGGRRSARACARPPRGRSRGARRIGVRRARDDLRHSPRPTFARARATRRVAVRAWRSRSRAELATFRAWHAPIVVSPATHRDRGSSMTPAWTATRRGSVRLRCSRCGMDARCSCVSRAPTRRSGQPGGRS